MGSREKVDRIRKIIKREWNRIIDKTCWRKEIFDKRVGCEGERKERRKCQNKIKIKRRIDRRIKIIIKNEWKIKRKRFREFKKKKNFLG